MAGVGVDTDLGISLPAVAGTVIPRSFTGQDLAVIQAPHDDAEEDGGIASEHFGGRSFARGRGLGSPLMTIVPVSQCGAPTFATRSSGCSNCAASTAAPSSSLPSSICEIQLAASNSEALPPLSFPAVLATMAALHGAVTAGANGSTPARWLPPVVQVVISFGLETICAVGATTWLVEHLAGRHLANVAQLYLCSLVWFASLYTVLGMVDPVAVVNDERADFTVVTYIFFSISMQSTIGVGLCVATRVFAQCCAVAQQLLGMVFHLVVIQSVLQIHNRELQTRTSVRGGRRRSRLESALTDSASERSRSRFAHLLRQLLRKWPLPFSIGLTALGFVTTMLAGATHNLLQRSMTEAFAISIVVLFLLVHLGLILCASMWIVRSNCTDEGAIVDLNFLAQSFLAVPLVFASVYLYYFLLFPCPDPFGLSLQRSGTPAAAGCEHYAGHVAQVPRVAMRLLVFSLSLQTGTASSNLVPMTWEMQAACSIQMLVQVLFTTVIFGQGLSKLGMDKIAETSQRLARAVSSGPVLRRIGTSVNTLFRAPRHSGSGERISGATHDAQSRRDEEEAPGV